MKNPSDGRVSHGMYGTRIYRIWAAMKRRCNNPNYHEFNLYGGRGISVNTVWNEFEEFYEWSMSNGYNDNLTLDRIDTNGHYEPLNCRWITPKEQANNRRSNVIIEFQGEEKNLKEWADKLGFSYKSLWKRIHNGWSIERAFSTPMKNVQTS
jgi:hypothetical protein